MYIVSIWHVQYNNLEYNLQKRWDFPAQKNRCCLRKHICSQLLRVFCTARRWNFFGCGSRQLGKLILRFLSMVHERAMKNYEVHSTEKGTMVLNVVSALFWRKKIFLGRGADNRLPVFFILLPNLTVDGDCWANLLYWICLIGTSNQWVQDVILGWWFVRLLQPWQNLPRNRSRLLFKHSKDVRGAALRKSSQKHPIPRPGSRISSLNCLGRSSLRSL